jgi:prepilin-type N-terminal cleavage/methylation domain-containing protein
MLSARRTGFSMIEMVVAMAILVILAAVVVPSIVEHVRQEQITSTVSIFNQLSDSVKSFKTVITQYPGKLSHLGTKIVSGDVSGCSGVSPSPSTAVTYGTNNTRWVNPFWPEVISTQGFRLPIGTANDQMIRTSNNTTAGFLQIIVPNVPYDVALDLNTTADGPNDPTVSRSSTTGMIRYGVPDAAELVQLSYSIPVAKTC